jgi:hypothetical protein
MLHAHVIAAMEEFLSGTFIHKITNSDELNKYCFTKNYKLKQLTRLSFLINAGEAPLF